MKNEAHIIDRHKRLRINPYRGFLTYLPENQAILFKFDFSASLFELFFETFCVSFGNTFLDGRGSIVNEFFGFFQTKTGEFFDEFYNLELGSAGSLQDNVKTGFLFSGFATSGGTGSNCNGCSGGFDAILVLEDLSEFVYFLNGKVNKLFSKSF